MGRRSSFSSRSSSKPSSRSSYAQAAPRPAAPAPAQAQSGGMLSGMMGTMFTGMAFGAGSEVAHQAVRGVMGGNSHAAPADSQQQAMNQAQAQPVQQAQSCQMENSNFVECLKFNSNNISACQDYLNLLKTCESQNK